MGFYLFVEIVQQPNLQYSTQVVPFPWQKGKFQDGSYYLLYTYNTLA